MSWKPSRADSHFSGARDLTDAVQPDSAGLPPCCARTKIVLRCKHDQRAFSFSMPVKGKGPWLSADVPPQNRRLHVMTDTGTPVIQVISGATHEPGIDVLNVRAEGPGECPPGTPSVITITPEIGAASSVKVPVRDWKVPLPSGIAAEVLDAAEPWKRPGVHPFCLPDLTPRTWTIAFPACPAKGLGMSVRVKAFPDVRWTGEARVQVKAENGPARPAVEGALTLFVDGRERSIGDWRSLRGVFPLLGMIDELTKTVNAVAELASPQHSRGLDSSRLQWHEPFRWDPMPSLAVKVESHLFEQNASGLLGHLLDVRINGEPLAGATGEANVLPLLMTNAAAEKMLAPVTGGQRVSIHELSTRYGVYLIAEGRCSLIASLRTSRPLEPIAQRFLSHGEVSFSLEARSESEFESLIVSSTAATKMSDGARLAVTFDPPPESPLPDPRDRKVKAQAAFTGLHLHGLEKISGSVRVRAWQPIPPDAEKPDAGPKPVSLLPARMWPPGTEPGQAEEIPWCHE